MWNIDLSAESNLDTASKLKMLLVVSTFFLGNRILCTSFTNKQHCTKMGVVPDLYYASVN